MQISTPKLFWKKNRKINAKHKKSQEVEIDIFGSNFTETRMVWKVCMVCRTPCIGIAMEHGTIILENNHPSAQCGV